MSCLWPSDFSVGSLMKKLKFVLQWNRERNWSKTMGNSSRKVTHSSLYQETHLKRVPGLFCVLIVPVSSLHSRYIVVFVKSEKYLDVVFDL